MSKVDDLRRRAEAPFPEAWRPEKDGESLVGVMARLEHGQTAYGPCPIVVLADPESGKETAVWLMQTALRSQFVRHQPQAGELVCVLFEGKRLSKSGQSYKSFRVEVDREKSTVSWDSVSGGDEEDPGIPRGQGIERTYIPDVDVETPVFDDNIPF